MTDATVLNLHDFVKVRYSFDYNLCDGPLEDSSYPSGFWFDTEDEAMEAGSAFMETMRQLGRLTSVVLTTRSTLWL